MAASANPTYSAALATMRQLLRYALWAFLGLAVVFLMLLIGEALFYRSLYTWFFERVREYAGLPDLLSGAIAVWCMALVGLVLPAIAWAVLFKRSKGVIWIASLLSVAWVLLYVLSLPREGVFFNPITGAPRVKWVRLPDGKIKMLPPGYKYDAKYRGELQDVTPAVVIEYEKQQQQETERGVRLGKIGVRNHPEFAESRGSRNKKKLPGDAINMWVEEVELAEDGTIVHVAASTWDSWTGSDLRAAKGAFLVDSNGDRYDLIKDGGEYPDYTVWDGWSRGLWGREIYRFNLVFPKLKYESPFVYLTHPQFREIKSEILWNGDVEPRHAAGSENRWLEKDGDPRILRNDLWQGAPADVPLASVVKAVLAEPARDGTINSLMPSVVQTGKPSEVSSPKTISSDGFAFELERCARTGQRVVCYLQLRNEKRIDEVFRTSSGKSDGIAEVPCIVDLAGNTYLATEVSARGVASNPGERTFSRLVLSGTRIFFQVVFDGIGSDAESVQLFRIRSNLTHVDFRNVSLVAETADMGFQP